MNHIVYPRVRDQMNTKFKRFVGQEQSFVTKECRVGSKTKKAPNLSDPIDRESVFGTRGVYTRIWVQDMRKNIDANLGRNLFEIPLTATFSYASGDRYHNCTWWSQPSARGNYRTRVYLSSIQHKKRKLIPCTFVVDSSQTTLNELI